MATWCAVVDNLGGAPGILSQLQIRLPRLGNIGLIAIKQSQANFSVGP